VPTIQETVVKLTRKTLLAMLAGSVFAIGLPQLWFNLATQSRVMPNLFSSSFMGRPMIAIVPVSLGLFVLALAIWRRSNNPFGYFSLGVLLTLIGVSFDFFHNLAGQFYFGALAIVYIILFVLPRNGEDHNTISPD